MGVSGCGKSTLARAIADSRKWRMIEGDSYHTAANIEKMSHGIALTDEDRKGWLDHLNALLRATPPQPTVLACSALKRQYRDALRSGLPRLGFVYLSMTRVQSLARVANRPGHFFPAALVDTQFATLEPPCDEPDVLTLPAIDDTAQQLACVMQWLQARQDGPEPHWETSMG